MKLYFAGDGSLIIAELNSDRTKVLATTLIPPDEFEVDKLTGYLAKLSGQEVFDLVTAETNLKQFVWNKKKEEKDANIPCLLYESKRRTRKLEENGVPDKKNTEKSSLLRE